jgi:hypothetical protein
VHLARRLQLPLCPAQKTAFFNGIGRKRLSQTLPETGHRDVRPSEISALIALTSARCHVRHPLCAPAHVACAVSQAERLQNSNLARFAESFDTEALAPPWRCFVVVLRVKVGLTTLNQLRIHPRSSEWRAWVALHACIYLHNGIDGGGFNRR